MRRRRLLHAQCRRIAEGAGCSGDIYRVGSNGCHQASGADRGDGCIRRAPGDRRGDILKSAVAKISLGGMWVRRR